MKIYFMGRRMNGRFDSFKSRMLRAIAWSKRVAMVALILSCAYFIGAVTNSSHTVIAKHNTITEKLQSPVLDRIADCESGDGTKGSATHMYKGQVITNGNKNGSVDIGKYQINLDVWGDKATSLGFDLATEEGNTDMAEWIYLNRGTGDWYSSQKCWKKYN